MRTVAPADLLALAAYLRRVAGLDAVSVGIVPDARHLKTGGYHCGHRDLDAAGRLRRDYSWRQRRDKVTSDWASAIDIGAWPGLRFFSARLAAACRAADPRTTSIRQVIYSPDGHTVTQFDAAGEQHGGDDSHLTHTHISFWRDTAGRRGPVLDLAREIIEGGDGVSKAEVLDALDDAVPWQSTAVRKVALKAKWAPKVSSRALLEYLFARVVLGHEPQVDVDEQAIAAAVLAGLSPAQIATAVLAGLPADLARQVVDELAGRLQAAAATGTAI